MNDVLGEAIKDYYEYNRGVPLWVRDSFGPKVEMPVFYYFRSWEDMPDMEKMALKSCKGKVLDIGAGAGCHSLELQNMGLEVHAIDISAKNVAVMKERSILNVQQKDVFTLKDAQYDTLLLLMNGIGLCSNLRGLRRFLQTAKKLLRPHGQLIFDSSDVSYLFEEIPKPIDYYFGEVKCRYEYKDLVSDWLTWLFIDRLTLEEIAEEEGWTFEILADSNDDQYLVKMQVKE